MGFVHRPDIARLASAGFASVADVPVVFLNGHVTDRAANRYLRERACLDYHPSRGWNKTQPLPANIGFPATSHLENIARYILDFKEWCIAREVDWRLVDYNRHILEGYQRDMLTGRWPGKAIYVEGPDGGRFERVLNPLAGGTVNNRIAEVCSFLEWAGAAFDGEETFRPPFQIELSRKTVADPTSLLNDERVIYQRVGKVRQNPGDLRIPRAAELAKWLNAVRVRWGNTKYLMVRTAIAAAPRRRELVEWRKSYLPRDRSQWFVIGDKVQVHLKFGCKFGRPRDIWIPISLAIELDDYRNGKRVVALRKLRNRCPGAADPDHLFLSEALGEPISYQRFYEAFSCDVWLPYSGWSPHLARHHWACTTLLELINIELVSQGLSGGPKPHQWVHDTAGTLILTMISPQLGHVNEQTTKRYLRWVGQAVTLSDQYLAYDRFLEGDE